MTEALVCSCTISYAGCSLFKWTLFSYRTHILNFQSCKFLDAAWFASLCVLFVLEVCFHKLHSFSHPRIPHLLSGKAYLLIFARNLEQNDVFNALHQITIVHKAIKLPPTTAINPCIGSKLEHNVANKTTQNIIYMLL